MALKWPAPKDPDEEKDYWVGWLPLVGDGETITQSDWSVVAGSVVIGATSIDNALKRTYVWLTGGVIDEETLLLNEVVTSGGRTYQQTCKLSVKAK